jgi:hypothetical protein
VKRKTLNSDGQTINKTNNYLSPQTIELKKKSMTYAVRIPDSGLDRHKNVAG